MWEKTKFFRDMLPDIITNEKNLREKANNLG